MMMRKELGFQTNPHTSKIFIFKSPLPFPLHPLKKQSIYPSPMGKKKMKLLPFSSSWPWPSCQQQPRTLSFQATTDSIFKTINSAFIGSEIESPSFSTASENSAAVYGDDVAVDSIENVIKGLRSERLFFEPGESNSILEEAKSSSSVFQLKQSKQSTLFLSLESIDPYKDFRKSMEEMVEAHGLKDWDGLQELLTWYLKVNSRSNHGFIFGAFVDLLVEIASASASASTSSTFACSSSSLHSPSSPLSSYTSSSSSSSTPCVSSSLETEEIQCLSSLLKIEEIRDKDDGGV